MKIAYHQNEPEITGPRNDLVDSESSTEMGARGFSANEMTSEYDSTDPSIYEKAKPSYKNDELDHKDIFDLLVEMGDDFDKSGNDKLAEFSDYLISKFAESKNIDYNKLYNQLMIKINNSDLTDVNDTLKKLTNIFSKTLKLEYSKNHDLSKSYESAYKKTLHRADQYMSES